MSDLRTRAGTILAATSIAGSFLAAKNVGIDTTMILAIVAYVACVGAAGYVLLSARACVVMAGGANPKPPPTPTPWPKTPPPGFGIPAKRGGSEGGKK